jgi:ABC-type dipeptide/oligopeptide/nickel transport system permease subunit
MRQAFYELGLEPALLALILLSWMPYASLAGASIVQLTQIGNAQAARSLCMRNAPVIRWQLLPNALPPVVVLAARDTGIMVSQASALTFIGRGASTEWGLLLVLGHDCVIGLDGNPLTHWWQAQSSLRKDGSGRRVSPHHDRGVDAVRGPTSTSRDPGAGMH